MTVDQTLALLALEIAELRARVQQAEIARDEALAELDKVKSRKRST